MSVPPRIATSTSSRTAVYRSAVRRLSATIESEDRTDLVIRRAHPGGVDRDVAAAVVDLRERRPIAVLQRTKRPAAGTEVLGNLEECDDVRAFGALHGVEHLARAGESGAPE